MAKYRLGIYHTCSNSTLAYVRLSALLADGNCKHSIRNSLVSTRSFAANLQHSGSHKASVHGSVSVIKYLVLSLVCYKLLPKLLFHASETKNVASYSLLQQISMTQML